jgi:hypothetical protein
MNRCGVVVWLVAVAACNVDLRPESFKCDEMNPCPSGWICARDGLCAREGSTSAGTDDDAGAVTDLGGAGGAGGAGAGSGGSSGGAAGRDASGGAGSGGSSGSGGGGAGGGAGAGGSGGAGGAAGQAECVLGEVRACYDGPEETRGRGGCADGVRPCVDGAFGRCFGAIGPAAESCNGTDDDCDGMTDEGTDVRCFPDGADGCRFEAGAFECEGACALGMRACREGMLSACEGAVVAVPETCTATGAAADEDCDDVTDEGCVCAGDTKLDCYPGPGGTAGVGMCKGGILDCANGQWGADCHGAVLPLEETCANLGADDDCDGAVDDIASLGAPCADGAQHGICAAGTMQCVGTSMLCVTPLPGSAADSCNGSDDDCDGATDEGYDLGADPSHCGSCGNACAAGTQCCGGVCSDPLSDGSNCGGCGGFCLAGCCAGWCCEVGQG